MGWELRSANGVAFELFVSMGFHTVYFFIVSRQVFLPIA